MGEEAKRVDAVECLPPDDVLGRAARRQEENGMLASTVWETYGSGRGSEAWREDTRLEVGNGLGGLDPSPLFMLCCMLENTGGVLQVDKRC